MITSGFCTQFKCRQNQITGKLWSSLLWKITIYATTRPTTPIWMRDNKESNSTYVNRPLTAYGVIAPKYDCQSQIRVNPIPAHSEVWTWTLHAEVQWCTASLIQDQVWICDRMLEFLEIINFCVSHFNFRLALKIAQPAAVWAFRQILLWWLLTIKYGFGWLNQLWAPVIHLWPSGNGIRTFFLYSLVNCKTCIDHAPQSSCLVYTCNCHARQQVTM